ncbi:IS4 family transposase [Flavobacterium franklandianum]|uniref:IS4 family transposase n=1 Tax=Flavobacterium franklandianum TaxID=2594430 RepID=UPI001179F3BC|nr:IS4 family transposase [Flavobacterium franklandianum]TRX22328.1 IS4 family transposase [Flavobacterium franklandianum]
MSKNSISIIKQLRKVIYSEEIISDYRMNEQDFTRKRKQPFCQVLLFMLNLLRKSMVIEIDIFLQHLNSKLDCHKVKNFTSSAFVQKRKKIKPEVFNYLSSVIIENYYVGSNQNIKRFNGFRVLAVDGSKITLPYTEELKTAFGESKNNTNTVVVQARSSILYDVLNRITLDSVLDKLEKGERELALKHSIQWKKNDLIIYDRGYPSYDFKYEHIKAGIDYLIRVQKNHSKIVNTFILSKTRTHIVDIFPQEKHVFTGKDYDKSVSIKVRLVRVDLPGGEIEILMTSLLDSQIYPASMFKELYFLRWGIETFYDELKNKLKLEYFTGYSIISIKQDFFCAIFISNLQSVIVNDLQEELSIKYQSTKLDYKINTNLSYGFLKNRILELLFKEAPLEEVFDELENLFLKNTIPIRLNRNNKREVGKYRNRIRPFVLKNQKDAI